MAVNFRQVLKKGFHLAKHANNAIKENKKRCVKHKAQGIVEKKFGISTQKNASQKINISFPKEQFMQL